MKKTLNIKILSLVVGLLLLAGVAGCTPRMAGAAMAGALVGATVVGVAHAAHRAHYHHVNCGCPRYHRHGRWVYHYQGGYEYYDRHAGVWVRY
jgi:hypothetical protein